MNILYDFEPAEHPQGKAVPSPCVGVCRMDQEKAGVPDVSARLMN
jgi:hypothetical protein